MLYNDKDFSGLSVWAGPPLHLYNVTYSCNEKYFSIVFPLAASLGLPGQSRRRLPGSPRLPPHLHLSRSPPLNPCR